MATVTCSAMNREPITNHEGVVTVFAKTPAALGTLATGTIIQFCKIPEHAMIIDGDVSRASAAGDVDISVGGTIIFVADSADTRLAFAGHGLVVSVTASDYPKYWVATGVTSSGTITDTIKVSISYTMNHQYHT